MNQPLTRLISVRERITNACNKAGRHPDEVSLLAVSKRKSASAITALHQLGIADFGENQLQEALSKQQELEALKLHWHYIGAIQSNKTRAIAEHFQWVQSVDRERILKRLAAQRPARRGPLDICLQVNIDDESQKSGATPMEVLQLTRLARGLAGIRLRGLMAIPMMTTDPLKQHDSFKRVKSLFDQMRMADHGIDTLSMGMSSDLEIAICEGSTMVRVGTDLLGGRN